jgi:hypothetical protein
MGWFLRKSFRIGPPRPNLSKRGLTASGGLKDARLGEVRRREEEQPPAPSPRSWWTLVVLGLVVGIILGGVLARAGEATRIDLFDTKGRRTGYAVVDRDTGRVDFYDTMSRRTGYGRVDRSGKVERFGLDGRRQGETAIPVLPNDDRRR